MIVRALAMIADVMLIAFALWFGTACATGWQRDVASLRSGGSAPASPPRVDASHRGVDAAHGTGAQGNAAGGLGPSGLGGQGLRGAAAPFSQSRVVFWSVRPGLPA